MTTQRIVVVTGASAGIGRASAVEFGRQGDRLALIARGEAGLAAAAREVEQVGGTAITVQADVSDPEQVEQAVDRIERELGPIDVWVNAAFTSVFAPFDEIRAEEFRRVTEVSYLGFVQCTNAVLRRMKSRDHGTIIQVGSALAYRGIPLQSAYCGAKHAIVGFTESLRTELLHDHSRVQVTMVHMPGVNTPQFRWVRSRLPEKAQPVPPIYQPEVSGRAVVYAAAHPQRREYWVGGSTVGTILGNRIAPGLLDRYLARTGFKSQQTGERRDPDQPDNLYRPLDQDRDHGTHGAFDNKAHAYSVQAWMSRYRAVLGAGAAAAAAVGAVVAARSRR